MFSIQVSLEVRIDQQIAFSVSLFGCYRSQVTFGFMGPSQMLQASHLKVVDRFLYQEGNRKPVPHGVLDHRMVKNVAFFYTDLIMKPRLESLVGSVFGSLSWVMQCCGFDPPPRRNFPVEGVFLFELTWVLTPFLEDSFGWMYKPRSSLCTHAFHCTDSKDPDIHVLDGWMPATETHPACTVHEDRMWLPQWFDQKINSHIRKNLTQNGEPQRCSWGVQKKIMKMVKLVWCL